MKTRIPSTRPNNNIGLCELNEVPNTHQTTPLPPGACPPISSTRPPEIKAKASPFNNASTRGLYQSRAPTSSAAASLPVIAASFPASFLSAIITTALSLASPPSPSLFNQKTKQNFNRKSSFFNANIVISQAPHVFISERRCSSVKTSRWALLSPVFTHKSSFSNTV